MPPSERTIELAKLRLLQYLSQPDRLEHGQLVFLILRDVGPLGDRTASRRLISDMLAAGLIERIQNPSDGRAHPLFITKLGREYLDEAIRQAVFPGFDERSKKWAEDKQLRRNIARREVATLLRRLPEFSKSDDDRIFHVSESILSEVLRHINIETDPTDSPAR